MRITSSLLPLFLPHFRCLGRCRVEKAFHRGQSSTLAQAFQRRGNPPYHLRYISFEIPLVPHLSLGGLSVTETVGGSQRHVCELDYRRKVAADRCTHGRGLYCRRKKITAGVKRLGCTPRSLVEHSTQRAVVGIVPTNLSLVIPATAGAWHTTWKRR